MEQTLMVIGCYPNTTFKRYILKQVISKLKDQFDIMLVSHYTIDTEIQQMVNYVIYDSNNEIHKQPGDYYSWYSDDVLYYEIHTDMLYNASYAVYRLIQNATHSANGLGYKDLFYIEGDLLVGVQDINKLFELKSRTLHNNKQACFFKSDNNHWDCQIFYSHINFLIQNLPTVLSLERFDVISRKLTNNNVIEPLLYELLYTSNINEVELIDTHPNKYLINSKFNLTTANDLVGYDTINCIHMFDLDDNIGQYLVILLRLLNTDRIFLLIHNKDSNSNANIFIDNYLIMEKTKHTYIQFKELDFVRDVFTLKIEEGGNIIKEQLILKSDILNNKDYIKFK